MIDRLTVRNYKSLRQIDIAPARLTALVGPNGSGKSTLLEAIEVLAGLATSQTREMETPYGRPACLIGEPGPLRRVTTHQRGERLSLEVARDDSVIRLEARPGLEGKAFYRVEWRRPRQHLQATFPFEGRSAAGGESPRNVLDAIVRDAGPLLSATGFGFNVAAMVRPAYSDEAVPRLARDGAGLPAVLAHLATTQPETLDAILDGVRAIVPEVGRLRMPRAEIEQWEMERIDGVEADRRSARRRAYWGHALEVEFGRAGFLPAAALSEGTLLTLALMTVIHGPLRPRVILLDDLDRALHPRAQGALVDRLRQTVSERDDLQIICTSHSPFVIDQFNEGEVWAVRMDDEGYTGCRRLSDHSDWPRWRDMMHLGEFWSAVGEQWVVASSASEPHDD